MRKVGMAVVLLATGLVLPALSSSSAQADGAGVGSPWVVSLGDSYISGEGGRWAGNSNNSSSSVDAGGAAAYFDNATHTAETINRCHRSTSAEISMRKESRSPWFHSARMALHCSGDLPSEERSRL